MADMSAANRGAFRRGRYARRSMVTPMAATTAMAMGTARKKLKPGMLTVLPKMFISSTIIMMDM